MNNRMYTIIQATEEIRHQTGSDITISALRGRLARRGYGQRIGRLIYCSWAEVVAICEALTGCSYVHVQPRDSERAAPEVVKPTYNTLELCDAISRRTGRSVNITWMGHYFTPSAGLRWTADDLMRICAVLRRGL